jgi:tetratricopeptide (TPR) repeat protein
MSCSTRTVLLRSAASLVLIALVASLGGCKTRSLVAVRESGDWYYKNGQYEQAEVEYKEYIQRAPGKAEVHQMLGNTYVKTGQTGMGREQLLLAHTLRMEDDQIFADMCEALYADKKYDDLNRELRQRTIDRGRMQDWALLATYSEKLGDRDEAQRAWLTAAQVDQGHSIDPQIGLARLYLQVGDMQRARKRAAMAYWISPGNPNVIALVKQVGEIPGPTLAMVPEEWVGPIPPEKNPTAAVHEGP